MLMQTITRTEYGRGSRRKQVLAYVKATIDQTGSAPSYGEIANALGITTRADVCRIVEGLEREGKVSRVGRGRVRRIRLEIYGG